ncbi:MAG: HAD-IB family hydrolase [Acidimicrobiaceae bacterium]|nr:HAD-IB family hydrolase [Acidimicrobiaceae bacterium]
MEAAFFDLDKTVIAKASMMAFGRAFHREGLLGRRALVKGLWTQLLFVRFGAGPKRLARIRRSALATTRGWEQAHVRRIVEEGVGEILPAITYADAVALIDEHRRAGRRVYIVSAAPAEIVEPLAFHLGVHEAIATRAVVDERGRYTGETEQYCYGPAKATLIRELARRRGIDLSASWGYSDSATDLPMLEVVGHPVVVNPDRVLRRVAHMRGWEIRRFERVVGVRAESAPQEHRWLAPGLAAAAVGSGGAIWWAARRTLR